MVHFNCLGLQYTFGILFKALLDDKEFQAASGNEGSTAASTWVGSISSCLMLLCSFPSGFLVSFFGFLARGAISMILTREHREQVQKYGMRPVAFSGAFLMFVGLQTASGVRELWLLYLTYGVVTGIGFALLWSCSVVAVNRYLTGLPQLAWEESMV